MTRRPAALLAAAFLLAAACGGGEDAPEEDDANAGLIEVTAFEFGFRPTELEVEPGARGEIALVNSGSVAHAFVAEGINVELEADAGGESTSVFTAPNEDTSIEFYCSFHRDQMQGTLVVGEGGSAPGGSGKDSEDEGGAGSDDYDY